MTKQTACSQTNKRKDETAVPYASLRVKRKVNQREQSNRRAERQKGKDPSQQASLNSKKVPTPKKCVGTTPSLFFIDNLMVTLYANKIIRLVHATLCDGPQSRLQGIGITLCLDIFIKPFLLYFRGPRQLLYVNFILNCIRFFSKKSA